MIENQYSEKGQLEEDSHIISLKLIEMSQNLKVHFFSTKQYQYQTKLSQPWLTIENQIEKKQ